MNRDTVLDAILDKLTDLAAAAPEPAVFYRSLLDALHELVEPEAVALWSVVGKSYRLEAADGLLELGISGDLRLQELHENALAEICHPDSSPVSDDEQGRQPSLGDWTERRSNDRTFHFFACRADHTVFLVIELAFPGNATKQSPRRLLTAIAEIAHEYYKSSLLRDFRSQQAAMVELNQLTQRIYSRGTLDETAYEIVNEVRRFLGCDRVSLLRYRSGRCQVLAVSAVAALDARARQLRGLESLTAHVLKAERHWQYPSQREEPPQRSELLQNYLDQSGTERLSIDSLVTSTRTQADDHSLHSVQLSPHDRREVIGGLVVESFSQSIDLIHEEQRRRVVLPHVQLAFRRAVELEQLPLIGLSRHLQRWRWLARVRAKRWLAVAVVSSVLLISTAWIPAELQIPAKGSFEPAGWQHVYAPLDGEIIEVLAEHQAQVAQGQPLLRMRSRDLELKKQELITERNVALEKQRGIEAARLGGRRTPQAGNPMPLELSATEREMEELISSLDKQLLIVDQMLSSLEIVSPITGQVASWNTAQSLERRPVRQGQRLLSLASEKGAGKLQLYVADSDIQHVIRAHEQAQANRAADAASTSRLAPGAEIDFAIATDPGSKHHAQVDRIGTIVESTVEDGPRVRVEARVEAEQLSGTRPGATVIAKIKCGRSNLAYVWIRRLWEQWLLWNG